MFSVLCAALRAEAALRARLPKDAKRNASISPYDKGLGDVHCLHPFQNELEEQKFPCIGELLQHTKKGTNSWLIIVILCMGGILECWFSLSYVF